MSDLVSVIVPAYNNASTLQVAIDSVLQQGVGLELIVIDDASEDDTVALLQRQSDRRLHWESLPRNQGVAAARNRGLARARGNWIQFLDADDWLLPGKLAGQIALAAQADIVTCDWQVKDAASGKVTLTRSWFDVRGDAAGQLLKGNCFPNHAPLFRREFIDRLGGFDSSVFHEDWDWLLRCALLSPRWVHWPSPGVVYFQQAGSRSFDGYQSAQHDARYLETLLSHSTLPVSSVLAALDAKYYQLGLMALRRGDLAQAEHWKDRCSRVGVYQAIEWSLSRRVLPLLGGRIIGPRRIGRELSGLLKHWRGRH